jgi:spore coat polysaccharide biosynthesis protein SpsF (cytidylyltransferase family)
MQLKVEQEFKEKFKQTFIEMLETERETLYPLFTEIMEDLALVRAMEEGENTREVKEENIIGLLQQ